MTEEHENGDGRTKRRYDSTRRQAQARETRQQILEAARRLFTLRGYAGTTVEAVAREAGVAVETVYVTFKSKRTMLTRLVDQAVGGDDEPKPLLDRPGPQRVRVEPDQRRQIALFARDMAEIMGRVGPLFAVMRAAAPTEPEIAELLRRLLATRHTNMRVFVQWLERNGPLRAGLSTDEAADAVWTLSSAEVYQLLTVDRGWPAEYYEHWLGETLIALLLPPALEAKT
jgi:AcrR family transcriptional regulator